MTSNRLLLATGIAFLFSPGLVFAQSGVPGITAANVPVLASGQMPSSTPTAEGTPENVLEGGILLGANYDDSAVPNAFPRKWDINYFVTPRISLQETRERVVWGFSYSPGIELSQNLLYGNQFAQKFGGNIAWRTTPHGTLSAQQYYLVTTNPFLGFSTTQPGPIISPNETIYLPNVRQTMILSNVLYSYQANAQTTMGFGGSFQQQKYDRIPQSGSSTPLIHAQVASGEAFISHQVTPRVQIGFQYGGQVLKFPKQNARTTTHSFLLFDQMNLSPNTSITLYGGPEYSLTSNVVVLNLGFIIVSIPVNANQWSGSGGVIYNWTGHRLAASVDFSRRVSDGGGLIGAVELTSGTAQLSWQIARSWSLKSTIAGADNQLLAVSSGNNELRTYSAQVGLTRRFGRDVALDLFYRRFNATGSINGYAIGNRDIVGVNLNYSFLKPLGGG